MKRTGQEGQRKNREARAAIVLSCIALLVVIVVSVMGIYRRVADPWPEVTAPVILPALTPGWEDEVVALGYESHLTGMFVELFMGAEVQDEIVCTAGCVITPTGTYQPLTSATSVTCTLEAAGAPGRYTGVRNVTYTTGALLWLTNNTTDTTITIVDGNTAALVGGTFGVSLSDTLTLFFDSSHWTELSRSNN